MSEMNKQQNYIAARQIPEDEYREWYMGKNDFLPNVLRDMEGKMYLIIGSVKRKDITPKERKE